MSRPFIRAVIAMAALLAMVLPASAETTTTIVTGDGQAGWNFNPDPNNATPYEFNEDQFKIGYGALYVKPIDSTPALKFIAALTLAVPTADVTRIAFDFLIDDSTANRANQFYLNVYTNLPGSTTYFDCRFDYVAGAGSTTAFSTVTMGATTIPSDVVPRGGASCPATLAAMPSGSTAGFLTLNLGDTGSGDVGLGGFFDNVQTDIANSTTIYDFEFRNHDLDGDGIEDTAPPTNKDQCKKGGWATFNNPSFRNQGQCVSYTNHS